MHANTAAPTPLTQSHSQPWVARRPLPLPVGLVALAFPWLFSSPWPVVALACAAVIGFRLLAACDVPWPRRATVGGGGSRDDIWLACGVCLTYLWSATDPLAYCIAILVLAFGLTAAALVRARCAPSGHASGGAGKSGAGSLALFVTALTIASAALIAGAGLRPGESLAAALLLATVTTGIEASVGDGPDILLVPVGALVALEFATL